MIPAFSACTESPEPGIRTSTTSSATLITSTSLCPAPTVSRKTTSVPAASRSKQGLQRGLGQPAEMPTGSHRADEDARVEKVLGEPDPVAEQRSVRERARGSTEITPTVRPSARTCAISAPISDDLPTPGGPVIPTAKAEPVSG